MQKGMVCASSSIYLACKHLSTNFKHNTNGKQRQRHKTSTYFCSRIRLIASRFLSVATFDKRVTTSPATNVQPSHMHEDNTRATAEPQDDTKRQQVDIYKHMSSPAA